MLKRTIRYENLDGEMVEKEFFFNLSKAELVEMEMTSASGGGFEESMKRIVESNDGKAIMKEFERIILATVGYRDGDDFIKTEEFAQRFKNSGAYSELFIELVTDAEAGARFINSVIPAHLAEKVRGMQRPGQPQDYQKKEEPVTRNVFDSQPTPAIEPTPAPPVEAPQPEQVPDPLTYDNGTTAQIHAVDQANVGGLTRREVREHSDQPIFPPYDA
jgi:hypothetical protein